MSFVATLAARSVGAAIALRQATITNFRAIPVVAGNLSFKSAQRSWSSESEAGVVPKIVFLGPPGVGKGTYAKRIAKWLNVPHIAVGDLLRNEMKLETELGKEVRRT